MNVSVKAVWGKVYPLTDRALCPRAVRPDVPREAEPPTDGPSWGSAHGQPLGPQARKGESGQARRFPGLGRLRRVLA